VNQHRMLTLKPTAIKCVTLLANSSRRQGHHRRRA
jgi:hypothetical protein